MTILAPPTTEPLRGEDTTVVTSPSPPTAFGYTDPPLPFQLGSIVSDVTHHLDLRLMAPLGNGSYAIVYLAQDEKTGKSYALKCLSKMTLTEEQLDVQSNEMTIHRSLPKHARIVQFLNSFETADWLFLLLEYIEGTDLYWWITQKSDQYDHTGRKLTERERLEVVRGVFKQCLEAVSVVHESGVSHRDLKPENFLVTKDHQIKLSDFGLSTKERYSTDFDCGSKPYMSYECRNPITPTYNPIPADIWSLGIIFLNLIWHRSPWSDPDPHSCTAFAAFQADKVGFLISRFEGMPEPVAKFLAHRVFCPVEDGRVKIKEWKKWCDKLVELMDAEDGVANDHANVVVSRTGTENKDHVTQPPTKRRTLGFSPLALTMSALKSSKSRESATSPKARKSLFPIISPPVTPPSTSLDARLRKQNPVDTVGTESAGSLFDTGKASWSEAFDFDMSDEMDFSQPIVFGDGVSVHVRSNSSDGKAAKRVSVTSAGDEDGVRSDNDSGFDEIEESVKNLGVVAPPPVVNDVPIPTPSISVPIPEPKVDEPVPSLPPPRVASSRPASPVQIVAESSLPKLPPPQVTKPTSGILKYIPPKIARPIIASRYDKFHPSSTHLPPPSPAIPIPTGRPDRHNAQTAPSFEDSSSSMASSFGGHGINVGGYAYNRRPFAPPPPAWRADKSGTYNSFGKKRGAREYGGEKRGARNSAAYANNDRGRSSGRSGEWNPWAGDTAAGSSPQYRGRKSGEYQRPLSFTYHGNGMPAQQMQRAEYFVPVRQENNNNRNGKSKLRKRSSTVTSSVSVFGMDSVSVFNNPMPGMTTYQSLKDRTNASNGGSSGASSNASASTMVAPAASPPKQASSSWRAGKHSNATSLSLHVIPPTPTEEPVSDPIATVYALRSKKSSPMLNVRRGSGQAPPPQVRAKVDTSHTEMQEKDVVFGEGYDDDEVTLNGGEGVVPGKAVRWEEEVESRDANLKVMGKSTMVEFTRLLKGIVGYNRGVKVGGEGKDVVKV